MENKEKKPPTLEEALAMIPKDKLMDGDKEMLAQKHPMARWLMALRSQGKSSTEIMKIMTPSNFYQTKTFDNNNKDGKPERILEENTGNTRTGNKALERNAETKNVLKGVQRASREDAKTRKGW